MFQNIFYEKEKNAIHLWDDQTGYSRIAYKKYAYKNTQFSSSIYGKCYC